MSYTFFIHGLYHHCWCIYYAQYSLFKHRRYSGSVFMVMNTTQENNSNIINIPLSSLILRWFRVSQSSSSSSSPCVDDVWWRKMISCPPHYPHSFRRSFPSSTCTLLLLLSSTVAPSSPSDGVFLCIMEILMTAKGSFNFLYTFVTN